MKNLPKSIYLHVGAGKTGTTSIQATIPLVRRNLKKAGLRAPLDPTVPPELAFRPRVESGYSFSLALLLNPSFYNFITPRDEGETWNWLEKVFEKAQDEGLNLLFSSEALQFAREAQLQTFKEVATRHCFEVKIIFYVRTALDYSISEYLQHLKTGFASYPNKKPPTDLNEYIKSAVIPFSATLSTYSNVFGRQSLNVCNYDALKSNHLGNFFTAVSGKNLKIPKSSQLNRSLTRTEQEALENLLKRENGIQLCQHIGNKLIQIPSPEDARPTYFVDEENIGKFASNNESLVTIVNSYLPSDQEISIRTDNSPVTTKHSEGYIGPAEKPKNVAPQLIPAPFSC